MRVEVVDERSFDHSVVNIICVVVIDWLDTDSKRAGLVFDGNPCEGDAWKQGDDGGDDVGWVYGRLG